MPVPMPPISFEARVKRKVKEIILLISGTATCLNYNPRSLILLLRIHVLSKIKASGLGSSFRPSKRKILLVQDLAAVY